MKVFRSLIVVFGLLFLVVVTAAVELYFLGLPSVDITTRLLLISLLTVNVFALLTLMFFVGKNIFKLYMERQRRVLGHKFRIKLTAIFVVLTLIPSAFLFITASGLAANYINHIFSPQMKEPFNQSIELARAFYDRERERIMAAARQISSAHGGQWTSALQNSKSDSLPGIHYMSLNIYRYDTLPPGATDTIKDAFNGKEGTEVISSGSGDIIRAVVPDHSIGTEAGKNAGSQSSMTKGVIVVESVLPKTISEKAEKLSNIYEDYLKFESFKEPLKLNYILILSFFTLMIVFTGLWVSLKISKGIAAPIQSLALATEQVTSGDLNVQVDAKSKDEIGLLISSFNQMVRQLKDNKDSIERAYMESDTRRLYLENILENINSGVVFLDNTGKILTINKAACSTLNVRQKDVLGKKYRGFIDGLNSEDLTNLLRDVEGREIREIKREAKINIDGKILMLMVYIAGIRESYTSKALGMLVVFDDLTDVIKAQKVIAWQEIAQRVAHEIKNPLTPIKLSTERLIKKWQKNDVDFGAVFEKATKTITSEVDSLKMLVDVFSRYGRMPEINKSPTDLMELLDAVVALYKGFKHVDINVIMQDEIPLVSIDKEQFKRVLINIIDNAVKAMNSQGVIDISVKRIENNIIINISDTGPGIRDEEKERLFIPYFSKAKGGTGLGLAIANKIVTDHSGRILIRDNNPTGTIFSIEIPITEYQVGSQ